MLVGRYKVCRTNLLVSVKGRKFARFGVLKPEGQSNNRIGGDLREFFQYPFSRWRLPGLTVMDESVCFARWAITVFGRFRQDIFDDYLIFIVTCLVLGDACFVFVTFVVVVDKIKKKMMM